MGINVGVKGVQEMVQKKDWGGSMKEMMGNKESVPTKAAPESAIHWQVCDKDCTTVMDEFGRPSKRFLASACKQCS